MQPRRDNLQQYIAYIVFSFKMKRSRIHNITRMFTYEGGVIQFNIIISISKCNPVCDSKSVGRYVGLLPSLEIIFIIILVGH